MKFQGSQKLYTDFSPYGGMGVSMLFKKGCDLRLNDLFKAYR